MGVHLMFVRSVNLDEWKEEEVEAMERGGNAIVNAYYEAHIGREPRLTVGSDGRARERFIRNKYDNRKFFDPNPSLPAEESGGAGGGQRKRVPSEAAMRRAKSKGNCQPQNVQSYQGTTVTVPPPAPAPTPAPTPAPAP